MPRELMVSVLRFPLTKSHLDWGRLKDAICFCINGWMDGIDVVCMICVHEIIGSFVHTAIKATH